MAALKRLLSRGFLALASERAAPTRCCRDSMRSSIDNQRRAKEIRRRCHMNRVSLFVCQFAISRAANGAADDDADEMRRDADSPSNHLAVC